MYIADLHIHSRYSRATSKDCTPEHLDLGARRKGIRLVGTGDFTHPAWREELKEKLAPAEDGLYVLKEEYRIQDETCTDRIIPRFVITGVWHTALYVIRMRDFQYAENLETTGFLGRSTHHGVPVRTTCFLLILYRPISKKLANPMCRL